MVVLCAVLISCEKDEASPAGTNGEALRTDVSIPFNGVYTTHPRLIRMDEEGTQTYQITSHGKAVPLGRSTWYSDSKVWNTAADKDGPWDQTGTSIFTTVEGAQLIGSFEGTAGPTEDSPIAGSGTFRIDHGTGIFEGATGGGTYLLAIDGVDPATGELIGQLEFTGTIAGIDRQVPEGLDGSTLQSQGTRPMPPPSDGPK